MSWPEKVPILDESDLCRNVMHNRRVEHCLLGWKDEVFGILNYEESQVLLMLKNEIGGGYVHEFNDREPLKKVAAVWNRVMRKLGYTVPCDR